LVDVQWTVYPHKWSPISCRSSVGQRKFAGESLTFYHCAAQPTNSSSSSAAAAAQQQQRSSSSAAAAAAAAAAAQQQQQRSNSAAAAQQQQRSSSSAAAAAQQQQRSSSSAAAAQQQQQQQQQYEPLKTMPLCFNYICGQFSHFLYQKKQDKILYSLLAYLMSQLCRTACYKNFTPQS